MSYRAIYAYAWDIAELGAEAFAAEMRGIGLNTVTLAGAYHAGKFIRPHGKGGKVYFPEDGTVYFTPDPKRYGRIEPRVNSRAGEWRSFHTLADAGLSVNAWMVLLHNTPIGQAHPECTVENAFGDRYVYSLCPSSPDARDFAVALCRDVTESCPVMGISAESPGFAPYSHGYHHEFALMRQNRWFDNWMGLCFCEHCRAGAATAGIDAEALRAQVRGDIEAWLASDFDIPPDMAEAFWLADTRSDGALKAYLDFRCEVVTSLVAEIRDVMRKDAALAIIPSVARPTGGAWYEGADLKALAATAGIIEACFYESSSARVCVDAFDVVRRLRGTGKLRGILRPAAPDLESKGEVAAAVAGLAAAGITDVAFYNYGHVRRASLGWIGAALEALEA